MQLNGENLLRLPINDSKSNYLDGFWRWVQILVAGEYQYGLESLYWSSGTVWTPEQLKEDITTFFGGDDPWHVIIPNERLIDEINDAAEFEPQSDKGWGWFMAQIPLTTEPDNPKDDAILLMGLAVSFFVREHDGSYVMEYEMFHV